MEKSIQDRNLLYLILSPLVQFAARCHYRRFSVHGLSNLPTNGSYIIAPCHQQALMEPMAVLNFSPKPPVFLARSDIFSKPLLRKILTFLKIMPVYRIRDGKQSLSKNELIFAKSQQVLLSGYPLCLMAEGRHNNRHRLLPLVKGMFRIAGETQKALDDKPLFIVPTGIDFDEYEEPYANCVVDIGTPIAVSPFMDTYVENEPVALNAMRDALAEKLKLQMFDIRDEDAYDDIYFLSALLNRDCRSKCSLKNNAFGRFKARQHIAHLLEKMHTDEPSLYSDSLEKAHVCRSKVQKTGLGAKIFSDHYGWATTLALSLLLLAFNVALVVCRPLRLAALFCLLSFPITFIPTHLIFKKIIKDSQFRSSVNFGVRFLFSILYTLVIAIVVACTQGVWMNSLLPIGAWWGLIAVAYAHLGAIIAGDTVCILRNLWRSICYWYSRCTQSSLFKDIEKMKSYLAESLISNSGN